MARQYNKEGHSDNIWGGVSFFVNVVEDTLFESSSKHIDRKNAKTYIDEESHDQCQRHEVQGYLVCLLLEWVEGWEKIQLEWVSHSDDIYGCNNWEVELNIIVLSIGIVMIFDITDFHKLVNEQPHKKSNGHKE